MTLSPAKASLNQQSLGRVFLKSQDESESSPEDPMRLKCAFSNNPRVQPLADGTVRIEGAECEWARGSPASLHLRHLKDDAFDVFEFSLSNFLIVRDRPEQRRPAVAAVAPR